MTIRVGIAGAGVAGRLLAWHCARQGFDVDVFDPSPESGAGFTSAGMLSPLAEAEAAPPEVVALGWRSLALWPALVDALPAACRQRSPFRREGSLLVAHPQDDGAARRVLARIEAAGRSEELRAGSGDKTNASILPRPQALDVGDLDAAEPALRPGLRAWLLPGEGQVDPPRLLAGLRAGAEGVRWHAGQRVDSVRPGRLQLADGSVVRVDLAIDARGVGARGELPVRGVRGELVWLHAPGLVLRRPVRLIHPRHRVYLVPRHGDHVLVGATEIESEDRSQVSLRSAVELLSAAQSIVPELAEARIVRLDTNLRPALPDPCPIAQCEDGLVRINGLYRHGWLVGPALVERVMAWCAQGALPVMRQPAHG